MPSLIFNRPATRPYGDDAFFPDARVQWWYFSAELENGYRLMTFFLPRSLGETDGHDSSEPIVEIVLMKPGGNAIRQRRFFSPSEVAAQTGRLDVSLGDECRLSLEESPSPGKYVLKAQAGRLGYDLELVPELPPWAPLGKTQRIPRMIMALARRSLRTPDYFDYVPFVPRGRLTGSIRLDGEAMEVQGTGYHEQGWMNFAIHRFVPAWYWMHIEQAPWTIISGAGLPPRGVPVPGKVPRGGIAYVAQENQCLMSACDFTGFLVNWERISLGHPQKPGDRGMAWEVSARFWRPGLKVRVQLHSREVLDYMAFEHASETAERPYWSQALADAEVTIRRGRSETRFSTQAILESMVTGM